MNNEVNNNNIQPKKKSNTWIIVLCVVLGCLVLIPIIIIGLIMLIAFIFTAKGLESYNELAENKPEISIHVDNNEDKPDISVNDDNQNTNIDDSNTEENNNIANDVPMTDDMKLAENLMERYSDSMYPSDCKSKLNDFIGSGKTVTPNSLDKNLISKYIFHYFTILHKNELTAANATPSSDNSSVFESKLTLSKEDYIRYGKILFGKDFNAEVVLEGGSDCYTFKYVQDKNAYKIIIPSGCGGACSPEAYFLYKLTDAKKIEDKFYVYYRVIYRDFNPDKVEDIYYADMDKKTELKPNANNELDYSKGELYVVEFEKNENEYSFVKSYRDN